MQQAALRQEASLGSARGSSKIVMALRVSQRCCECVVPELSAPLLPPRSLALLKRRRGSPRARTSREMVSASTGNAVVCELCTLAEDTIPWQETMSLLGTLSGDSIACTGSTSLCWRRRSSTYGECRADTFDECYVVLLLRCRFSRAGLALRRPGKTHLASCMNTERKASFNALGALWS